VPLPAPAPADSLPVSLVDTSEPHASKSVWDFRYVYTHRQKVLASEPASVNPLPEGGPPPQPLASLSDLDIPNALYKRNRSCTNHPISKFVSYDLYPSFRQFALSVFSEYIFKSCEEALLVPVWKQVMDEEMDALISRGTWELILTPTNAVVVGYRRVYILKFNPNGSVNQYTAKLVAKGYTQTYDIDYFETFSPVAWMNFIRIFIFYCC